MACSHEKKKKYLAELNSRCRTLYHRPGLAHSLSSQYSTACQYPWSLNPRLCPGNLYTPTPEQPSTVGTVSTVASPATAEGGAAPPGWWRLPWKTGRQLPHSASEGCGVGVAGAGRPSHAPRPPHWRYSQSDAVYGFRPPVRGAPGPQPHLSQLSQLDQIDSLASLLWGPPPPYSQPASVTGPGSGPDSPGRAAGSRAQSRPGSTLSRTTKSGILVTQDCSPAHSLTYDHTVDSAMHIYERVRRGRADSLPGGRPRSGRHPAPPALQAASTANIPAEPLDAGRLLQQSPSGREEELRTAKEC